MPRNRMFRVRNARNNNAFSNQFAPAGAGSDNDLRNNRGVNGPHDIGTSYGTAGTNASDNVRINDSNACDTVNEES